MPRQWNNQENINTWVTHRGKSQGGDMQATGVFTRQRPKANMFRTLFNTSKKGNTQFTREGMIDTQFRILPSSARQIYGKVLEKIFHTLFRKGTGRRKQDNKDFPNYGGKIHSKRDMCMHHILEKCRNPNCSFYHAQAK